MVIRFDCLHTEEWLALCSFCRFLLQLFHVNLRSLCLYGTCAVDLKLGHMCRMVSVHSQLLFCYYICIIISPEAGMQSKTSKHHPVLIIFQFPVTI